MTKFNLKLPNVNKLAPSKDVFGIKHKWVPKVNNNVIYITAALAIGGLWYASTRGYLPFSFPFVGIADSIELSATPLVRPGDPVIITGNFSDSQGNSVSVPQAYLQVVEDLGTVKLNESLGVNVNRFTKTIDTTGYRGGGYTITVSDRPVTAPATPTSSPPPTAIQSTGGGEGFGLIIA